MCQRWLKSHYQARNGSQCLAAVFSFGCYNPKHQPVPLDYMSQTSVLQTPSQWRSFMNVWNQEFDEKKSLIRTPGSHHECPAAHVFPTDVPVEATGALPVGGALHWSSLQPPAIRWLLLLLLPLLLFYPFFLLHIKVFVDAARALFLQGLRARAEPLYGAVKEFRTAEEGCYRPDDEVEAEKDGLLCRTGGEAVHGVGAGKAAAGELGLHLEAIQQPLANEKPNFGQNSKHHVDNIKPP